jgi:hypothetical protein
MSGVWACRGGRYWRLIMLVARLDSASAIFAPSAGSDRGIADRPGHRRRPFASHRRIDRHVAMGRHHAAAGPLGEPVVRAAQPGGQEAGQRAAHRRKVFGMECPQLRVGRVLLHQVVEAIDDLTDDIHAPNHLIGGGRRLGRGLLHAALLGFG